MSKAENATQKAKRIRQIALLCVVLSAAGLWGASRLKFVTVAVDDDKAGASTKELVGSVWDPALVPLALAMVAALILSMAVQPMVRRVLGVVIGALAATASFRAVQLLSSDVTWPARRAYCEVARPRRRNPTQCRFPSGRELSAVRCTRWASCWFF